jgi:metallo-beta-lactamase family protein
LEPVSYGEPVQVNDRVSVTFHDAGHILGSALVDLSVGENGQARRILFSGDLGQTDKPIVADPTFFTEADYIVMESTYGDRDHRQNNGIEKQLADAINTTVRAGGNVVIPTFAVERAQELMFYISRLVRKEQIPSVPIYLDSPMAVDVNRVFEQHAECFDEETRAMIASGQSPLRFPGLRLVESTEQSKAINDQREPSIIMATSGMCTAGRIKHHLCHNIQRAESTILFVGFQVPGTLGRQILDGAREVRIHGRMWLVRARVAQIEGFSGHADRAGLLRWLDHFQKPPRRLFLTHGEEQVALGLAEQIRKAKQWDVAVPQYQEKVALD